MSLTCPVCREACDAGDEFCPRDGTPLVVAAPAATPCLAAEAPNQATAADSIPAPEYVTPPVEPSAPAASVKPSLSARAAAVFGELSDRFLHRAAPSSADAAPASTSPLPPNEHDKGWRIAGAPVSTRAFDAWPVVMQTGSGGTVQAVFRRYRTPSLTSKATYDALAATTGCASVHLYSFGTSDAGGGARLDYEITARSSGQSVQHWNQTTPPSPDKAAFLEPLLGSWLQTLQAAGFSPFAFSPDLLWLSEDNKQLTLAALSGVAMLEEVRGPRFEADLANSACLSVPYAAPELIERRVITDNSAVFTLGQLLSAALWGEPQEHAFIRNGSLPFAAIDDPRLARLLMGTLWPKIDGRWSIDEFLAALASDAASVPAVPPWASLRPGAASTAFTLHGEDYWLAEDLLAAAAKHWDEAVHHLDALLTWLGGTRFAGAVALLRQGLLQGRSPDWTLARLCRLITPDAPLVWRGHAFSDQDAEHSLIVLAQQALGNSPQAAAATADLRHLFEADLRGAFAPAGLASLTV